MTRLGDVAELISGQHVNAEHVNSAGIGNPYLTGPSDFDAGKPRATKWTEHGKAFCEPGDILITVKGSGCGTMAIADRRYVISRQLMAIRPLKIHVGFLWATLSREIARLNAMSSGTIPGLTRDQILKIPIPHFSDKVQRWIGDLDNLLTRLQQCLRSLIAAKREFKRGLMQELLTGRRRFPEYGPSHNGTEGPPAGWKEVKLGDLGRVVSGGTPSTKVPEYWDGGIAWCTPSDITALKSPFIDGTERELSEKGVENSSAEVLPPYSVIVCTRATIGAAAINRIPMATNQGFKSIIPEEGYCAEFIYYLVLHNRNQLLRRAAGSTFLEVSADSFSSLPVFVPESTAEQRRIADVLLRLDEEIQLLEQLLDQFDINKRGLMQKLLTGELTVPVSSEPEPIHV